LESGKPDEFEATIAAPRTVSTVSSSAALHRFWTRSGRVVKWCGINTDIERVRALAPGHLVEAQRLSQTGSFTWDVLRDEHVWSEEMCRIFEIDPATKITSHTGRDMILPEESSGLRGPPWSAGSAGRDELDFAGRILTARGTVKHVHAVAQSAQADPPTGRCFSGAVRDVTENMLAEDALNKVRAELTHVARTMALSALTASITHEVNQPLSGIVTNADTCLRMLASEPPNLDGARTTAQRMLRDANRAADVIQRLRTLFERKQPLSGPVDLSDAAREVLSLASSELQGIGVIVQTDFEENLPAVSGDRVQLQQVILNLVMNAADAMKTIDGRARKLLVATARDNSTRVRLSLRDSG
jgi:signal transduction histidine kinase